MRRTLVVAVREYQAAVRAKSFVISLILLPVMGSLGVVIALLFADGVDTGERRYAVVDQTGVLFDDLSRAADYHNRNHSTEKTESGHVRQVRSRFALQRVDVAGRDLNDVRAALSKRVRKGEISGFVEIPSDAVVAGLRADDGGVWGDARSETRVTLHSDNPMYRDFAVWLSKAINHAARKQRAAQSGIDPDVVRRVAARVRVEDAPLYAMQGGVLIGGVDDDEHYIHVAAGIGLGLLMFLVIFVGAMPLTYSVLEEKMQRCAEVLLGAVSPFQFMMGKILGMVGVSLTIVTIYIVAGFVAACFYGYGHTVPRHLLNWFILYQAGAILMFGSIFAAIGAACSDMKDAQNLMTPASLIACIPLFAIHPVLIDPNGTFATALSFFPPATPVVMLIRQGLPAPVPWWHPVLGLALVFGTSILCVSAAARVFRIGILMQGEGASLRTLTHWILRGEGRPTREPHRRALDREGTWPDSPSTSELA